MSDKIWTAEAALWYADNYGDHPANLKIVELANLKPTDSVLDIGCGSGTAVFSAAQQIPDGKAVGIDPTLTMVEIARAKLAEQALDANIEFLQGGAEHIPANDGAFDVVLALNSLHHWTEVDKGLGEVKRVLRENGRFLIGTEQFEEGHNEWPNDKIIEAVTKAGFKQMSHTVVEFDDAMMDFVEWGEG